MAFTVDVPFLSFFCITELCIAESPMWAVQALELTIVIACLWLKLSTPIHRMVSNSERTPENANAHPCNI